MSKTKAVTVVDPESGEIAELGTEWESPTAVDLQQLRRFSDIPREPMLIVSVGWSEGKRQGIEGKECALIAYLQASSGTQIQGAYSFSESIIKALKNITERGGATLQRPMPCKPEKAGPTAAGYYVDKLVALQAGEETALRKALGL